MTRLLVVAAALAITTGCLTAGVSPQVATDGTVGIGGEARLMFDRADMRSGPVFRGRGGPGWGDGGLGLDVCKRTYGWNAATFCGRVMALELGSRDGLFELGALSPAVSVGLWKPTDRRPEKPGDKWGKTSVRGTNAIEVQLSVGLDVRPLHRWQGTRPYLAITIAGGLGASWY